MAVLSGPQELLGTEVHVDLDELLGRHLMLRCEGFNFGGSIKMRTAAAMVAAADRDHAIGRDTVLIESSSGNLGVALSAVAARRRIPFVCVTDVRCNPAAVRAMRVLGARIEIIEHADPAVGLLGLRKDRVRQLCDEHPEYLWLNQYENPANWIAHYEGTAPAIGKEFPDLDVLFVGVGTGGTVMGCARWFRENAPAVRVVAVDVVGSTNLGGPRGPRTIPGLGAHEPAPALDLSLVDDGVYVTEVDTVRACRSLATHGYLFGGSTGSALSGAVSWLERHDPGRELTSVVIAPDLGDRYLDTIYDDEWVIERHGAAAVRPCWVAR